MSRYKTVFFIVINMIFILTLVLSASGCDRLIDISGKVYEWVNAPQGAASKIYHKEISANGLLKDDLPEDIELLPLSDVHVQCFGDAEDDSFYYNEVSDEEGKFRLVISLGQKTDECNATLEASHAGFSTVKREFTDTGESHLVTVVMVRQPETAE
jgi:hypothetical protein